MDIILKNKLIITTLLFTCFVKAQPGYSGSFQFKVYNNKTLVNLSDSNWKVITKKNLNTNLTQSYKFPDYYEISIEGGNGREDLFVDIIFKKDTMRIYPPSIDLRTVTLDSISFKKGIFKIPNHIYDLKDLVKNKPKYYKYIPSIESDWDLFSVNKEVYKCFIEKIEDLDMISTSTLSSENGNSMNWNSSTQFYFKKNYIIKHHDGYDSNNHWDNKHFIYEIKNINDSTFWGGKINRYEILSLYAKENALYALIKKSYADLNKDTYGVYKLYFVGEEKITNKLAVELNKQQIEEDYKSAMKLQGYSGAIREKIKIKYKTLK
ncbi:hypothetical protein NAT47_12340 [Flavobacterium sp. HXWNR69]|uniref:Uncharacterized protein n=1 Tax=Flavobacterium fragile TaxID=2949085 RepID=A0ABT0TJQ0_9FLAO|nr:hypothetical protein [Flavobacterium sp. HXWNR69]MCL9771203.1 hypothetical protein [Flavobacterium sp. HXWNR69]